MHQHQGHTNKNSYLKFETVITHACMDNYHIHEYILLCVELIKPVLWTCLKNCFVIPCMRGLRMSVQTWGTDFFSDLDVGACLLRKCANRDIHHVSSKKMCQETDIHHTI